MHFTSRHSSAPRTAHGRLFAASALAVVLYGCGASDQQLRARAAFDLHCPASQLTITEIDGASRGVTGCGAQAAYVEHCVPRFGGAECTWTQDTRSSPSASVTPTR